MSETVTVVSCPTCRAAVRWQAASRFRPFCSERCKLIDLGQWADEGYRVPAVEAEPMEQDFLG
jgi:hypothetical protein